MGRVLLTTFVCATLLACTQGTGSAGQETATQQAKSTATTSANAHAELACAACHQGPRAAQGRAAVPARACTASGCHADGGPTDVHIATTTIQHHHHGDDRPVQSSCTGCHMHDNGNEPLRTSVDACALCHLSQVQSSHAQDCRLCHQHPSNVESTSQGVPIPHASLPWIETGCVRCHYDVSKAPVAVPMSRCSRCHTNLTRLTRQGIGKDLHPAHAGIMCTACHDSGTHTVQAMSSAVDLACSDCHQIVHGRPFTGAWDASSTCDACHGSVHRGEQELFLGVLPGAREALPSNHFLVGLTCRSCHVPPSGRPSDTPVRATAQACTGCHLAQYTTVLHWWRQGLERKETLASDYVRTARRQIAGIRSDSADALLASADAMLDLVRRAGGEHNLELADRAFRESVQRAQAAYGVAGKSPPAPPSFGTEPHAGLCSYCHYRSNEPWDFSRMSQAFHARVMDQVRKR